MSNTMAQRNSLPSKSDKTIVATTLKALPAIPNVKKATIEQIYDEIERCHILERLKFDFASASVTKEEIVEAEWRKTILISATSPHVVELEQRVRDQNKSLKRLQKQINEMKKSARETRRFVRLEAKKKKFAVQNKSTRVRNAALDTVAGPKDRQYEMHKKIRIGREDPYAIGTVPPANMTVPKSKAELNGMTKAQVSTLFDFYALNLNVDKLSVAECRKLLHHFLTNVDAEVVEYTAPSLPSYSSSSEEDEDDMDVEENSDSDVGGDD